MPSDVQVLTHLADVTWQWAETFMPRLLAALAILVAGFIVAGWVERARQTLIEVAAKIPGVMTAPAPQTFLASFAGGTLVLSLMAWTAVYDTGTVERAIVEGIKRALDALGNNFKPTQIARTVPPDNDPSRFLGGESVR